MKIWHGGKEENTMKENGSYADNTFDYEEMDLEIHGSRNKKEADALAAEIAENAIPEAKK